MSRDEIWPELTLSAWEGTRDTFHLWTQIVGKVRLLLEPRLNHWWHTTLYVSARGLTTSVMRAGERGVEMEFDLIDHVLRIRTSDPAVREVALRPRTVRSFHEETMSALRDLGVSVRTPMRPNEVIDAIPFAQDEVHAAYDPDAAQRFWRVLLQARRLMTVFRARFTGKASPVHYFWGGADIAVTRFSGGTAPLHPGGVPNCPDWVQQLAYSHEVSSCGFWPGGSDEGSFYAYAYPSPAGFGDRPASPGAYYDRGLGEFLLPYRAVRTADDPDAMVLTFFQSTYEAAAELLGWDRAALEVGEGTGPG